jgi:hypothetical protein
VKPDEARHIVRWQAVSVSLSRDGDAQITEGAENFRRDSNAADATGRTSEGAGFGLAIADSEAMERRGSERTTPSRVATLPPRRVERRENRAGLGSFRRVEWQRCHSRRVEQAPSNGFVAKVVLF